MSINPNPDRTSEIYEAIDAFQRTHRLPGFQHAQIRGLLAEHLARVLPAVSVVPPATNQTALRDRIRRAVCEAEGFAWDSDMLEPDEYGDVADAVLAVLPPPVDRAAVLAEAAARYEEILANADTGQDPRYWTAVRDITLGLRAMAAEPAVGSRVAAETPQPETRDALMQAHVALAAQAGRDQAALTRVRQLHDALDAETELTSPDDEITRGAAARKIAAALDGWTAPTPPAVVAQPGKETSSCGPTPDTCDAEAGEPCANHEREAAHAEGEHCFCGPECDAPTEEPAP